MCKKVMGRRNHFMNLFCCISVSLSVSFAAFANNHPSSSLYSGVQSAGFSKLSSHHPLMSLANSIQHNAQADDGKPTRDGPNEALRQSIENTVNILSTNQRTRASSPSDSSSSAVVHIIGTGLSPTLLSLPLTTLKILSDADVVLYDSLGLPYHDICQIVPQHCELVCVGKRGDSAKSWKQNDIDMLLLQMALETGKQQQSKPKTIVRLKGGDPFLFGRTRSEIEMLRTNDIAYTYTPGISSCIAAAHLGGIPLTDAELGCQSFGVWSGTDEFGKSRCLNDDTSEEMDFAPNVDVLVFLMIGRLDKLEALCTLLAFGRNGTGSSSSVGNGKRKWSLDTPCAVIQNAGGIVMSDSSEFYTKDENPANTLQEVPVQKVWRSTLGSIVSVIRSEDVSRKSVSPAVFVVGQVCELDLNCK
jgi:siroheme synthase